MNHANHERFPCGRLLELFGCVESCMRKNKKLDWERAKIKLVIPEPRIPAVRASKGLNREFSLNRKLKKLCASAAAKSDCGCARRPAKSRLEVDASGELKVAAAGIAGGAADSSKVRIIHVGRDAAKRHLIGNVLAIGAKDEFPSFADVKGAVDAAVQRIRARIAQAIVSHGPRRIAKHVVLRV